MGNRHRLVKNRGDTLIEILITFFIIAVGVLGASSMQIVALQNVNGSSYRDQAIMFAENLSEEIRARAVASRAWAANPNLDVPDPGILTNNPDSLVNEYAAFASGLPSGSLGVTAGPEDATTSLPSEDPEATISTNNVPIIITVRWDEDRNGSQGKNCPVNTTADLDCYRIQISP